MRPAQLYAQHNEPVVLFGSPNRATISLLIIVYVHNYTFLPLTGERAVHVDSRLAATYSGNPADWFLVPDSCPGIPTAPYREPTDRDRDMMRAGCSQGCGQPATVRYMTCEDEPFHVCFFCNHRTHSQSSMHKHMDETCPVAKLMGYKRSTWLIKARLPPTKTTGCGHTFCATCANNSVLTKPPKATCFVCGKVAEYIARDPDHSEDPAPAADSSRNSPRMPEIYQSGNLYAHHLARFFQLRKVPFYSATAEHLNGLPLQQIPLVAKPGANGACDELRLLREKTERHDELVEAGELLVQTVGEYEGISKKSERRVRHILGIARELADICKENKCPMPLKLRSQCNIIEDGFSTFFQNLPEEQSPALNVVSTLEDFDNNLSQEIEFPTLGNIGLFPDGGSSQDSEEESTGLENSGFSGDTSNGKAPPLIVLPL